MKKSTILVGVIWTYVIGSAIAQGFMLPSSPIAKTFPFPMPLIVAMPLLIVVGAFFTSEIPGEFSIGKRIDQWFGQNSYRAFMKSLKLELLLSSMSFGIGIIGIARSLQIDGPSGAYSICTFCISAGFAFLIAYFVGRRKRNYENPSPVQSNIAAYSTLDAAKFWKEARLRSNLFFAAWVGWLLAGPLLIGLYSLILPSSDDMTRGTAALVTWGAVFIWSHVRIRQLRCYRCGRQALSGPMFFMKHAKCRNCGVMPQDP
jgi:hypothetical protein